MQRLVEEHEVLQGEVGMERGRRKKTKRALKEVLRREQIQGSAPSSAIEPEYDEEAEIFETSAEVPEVIILAVLHLIHQLIGFIEGFSSVEQH